MPVMALAPYFHASKTHQLRTTRSSGERLGPPERPPAEQFSPLASKFRRRLVVGLGSASLVAIGADFAGITSFLLGLSPEASRSLKLDVIYPIGGYSRCVERNEGFEFIYPARWVGDQRLLYRAAERSESERSLDLPSLNSSESVGRRRRRRHMNEPVVAFGPPGSTGELNVSVIVSPVSLDFKIEAFGGAKEVGEAVVKTITGSGKRADVKGSLIKSTLREDTARNIKYYELEFRVETSLFQRHNFAVCCVRAGKLFTLNAQTSESTWPKVKSDFHTIAHSFTLISS